MFGFTMCGCCGDSVSDWFEFLVFRTSNGVDVQKTTSYVPRGFLGSYGNYYSRNFSDPSFGYKLKHDPIRSGGVIQNGKLFTFDGSTKWTVSYESTLAVPFTRRHKIKVRDWEPNATNLDLGFEIKVPGSAGFYRLTELEVILYLEDGRLGDLAVNLRPKYMPKATEGGGGGAPGPGAPPWQEGIILFDRTAVDARVRGLRFARFADGGTVFPETSAAIDMFQNYGGETAPTVAWAAEEPFAVFAAEDLDGTWKIKIERSALAPADYPLPPTGNVATIYAAGESTTGNETVAVSADLHEITIEVDAAGDVTAADLALVLSIDSKHIHYLKITLVSPAETEAVVINGRGRYTGAMTRAVFGTSPDFTEFFADAVLAERPFTRSYSSASDINHGLPLDYAAGTTEGNWELRLYNGDPDGNPARIVGASVYGRWVPVTGRAVRVIGTAPYQEVGISDDVPVPEEFPVDGIELWRQKPKTIVFGNPDTIYRDERGCTFEIWESFEIVTAMFGWFPVPGLIDPTTCRATVGLGIGGGFRLPGDRVSAGGLGNTTDGGFAPNFTSFLFEKDAYPFGSVAAGFEFANLQWEQNPVNESGAFTLAHAFRADYSEAELTLTPTTPINLVWQHSIPKRIEIVDPGDPYHKTYEPTCGHTIASTVGYHAAGKPDVPWHFGYLADLNYGIGSELSCTFTYDETPLIYYWVPEQHYRRNLIFGFGSVGWQLEPVGEETPEPYELQTQIRVRRIDATVRLIVGGTENTPLLGGASVVDSANFIIENPLSRQDNSAGRPDYQFNRNTVELAEEVMTSFYQPPAVGGTIPPDRDYYRRYEKIEIPRPSDEDWQANYLSTYGGGYIGPGGGGCFSINATQSRGGNHFVDFLNHKVSVPIGRRLWTNTGFWRELIKLEPGNANAALVAGDLDNETLYRGAMVLPPGSPVDLVVCWQIKDAAGFLKRKYVFYKNGNEVFRKYDQLGFAGSASTASGDFVGSTADWVFIGLKQHPKAARIPDRDDIPIAVGAPYGCWQSASLGGGGGGAPAPGTDLHTPNTEGVYTIWAVSLRETTYHHMWPLVYGPGIFGSSRTQYQGIVVNHPHDLPTDPWRPREKIIEEYGAGDFPDP